MGHLIELLRENTRIAIAKNEENREENERKLKEETEIKINGCVDEFNEICIRISNLGESFFTERSLSRMPNEVVCVLCATYVSDELYELISSYNGYFISKLEEIGYVIDRQELDNLIVRWM